MTNPENNVSRLADLFGSMAELGRVCDITRSLVKRWRDTDGLVPWKYNKAIRKAAVEAWQAGKRDAMWVEAVIECLSEPTCPTCGQSVSPDRVL